MALLLSQTLVYHLQAHGQAINELGTRSAVFIGARSEHLRPMFLRERRRELGVQRWTEMARGGHFAAMEEPELLAADIRTWFQKFRGEPA